MIITIKHNFPEVQKALERAANQVPYALSVAINKTAAKARGEIQKEMPRVFDRPTPWVINSLRLKYANKRDLSAEIAYKDKNSVESSRSMIEPHVFAGKRHYKAMEARLWRAGILPSGYNAVPGAAAKTDSYGNMSRGQITQMLNILGTYREAGFNKANAATRARLAKGNAKKNVYGAVYFVNPVGSSSPRGRHLKPGVYQRISTAFGSSLKPILIFVRQANYRKRLDFFGIAERVINQEFVGEFNVAFDEALRTALFKQQGTLL